MNFLDFALFDVSLLHCTAIPLQSLCHDNFELHREFSFPGMSFGINLAPFSGAVDRN